MTVAHVVPLRRFPSDHQWFDYVVPPELSVTPGQLVHIPFLRQHVSGIVWNITDTSSFTRLKSIYQILRPEPVMTEWQRQVCLAIAEQSLVSLGHVLDSVIPNFPKRKTTVKPQTALEALGSIIPTIPPAEPTWWYRSRPDALAWLVSWMRHDEATARVIVAPTMEDGQELFSLVQPHITNVALVHGKINRTHYAQIYEGIRQGQIKHVIGTGRALTLPYPIAPQIVIDQEEHPSHKQTEQHPRTDYRRIAESVKADVRVTTPAPSVRWWYIRQPEVPPPGLGQRLIAELGQTRRAPWLTSECEALVEEAQKNKRPLLFIAPQHGYANSISCRDCHLTVDCQQCHQRLRLFRQPSQFMVCKNCGRSQSLPTACPRCRGTRWGVHGWGVEYIAQQLKLIWPTMSVQTENTAPYQPGIILDTYRGYRRASQIQNLAGVVVLNGDALLNFADFSVAERAWQFLARLQAQAPAVPVMVQTFTPANDFWQRWREWNDRAWYESELKIRERHDLPPVADQWIARYPGPKADEVLQKKMAEIQTLNKVGLNAVVLPNPLQSRTTNRLLITATGTRISDHVTATELFPFPWQIDSSVTSWLS